MTRLGARVAGLEPRINNFLGGHKNFFPSNSRVKTKKKNLHGKICAKFHKFWDEDQIKVFIVKSAKKRFFPTNTGLMTSILGVSGPELHSNCTEPVTFFGAQSSLGMGNIYGVGGTSSDLRGHDPKIPSVTPGLTMPIVPI